LFLNNIHNYLSNRKIKSKYLCSSPLLKSKAEKQPFWKKSWFTLFIVILIIAIAATAIVYIFYPTNGSPNTINLVEPEANRVIFKAEVNILNVDVKAQPTSRVWSVATTNGDYFKKCAPFVTCNPNDKYRTYNGSCNNLQNPNWGAALTPFYRLMDAEFNDGNIR
jgi:hypothetical protein